MKALFRMSACVLVSVALFFMTRAFLFEMFKIPTPSMQRTLMVGDFLVVDKVGFWPEIPFTHIRFPVFRHPHRDQIVVFKWPSDTTLNFVKRVVGVPGDTLYMRSGQLLRNGRPVVEPYVSPFVSDSDVASDAFRWQRDYLVASLQARDPRSAVAAGSPRDVRTTYPSQNNWGPLLVPKGNYFVMGDNRSNSLDSRYWGFVPDSLMRGTPLFVYFSYAPDSTSHFSWLMHARWRRFGTIIR